MDSEVIPLTNCEAMYQAAVSKQADNTVYSGVLKFVHEHVLFQQQNVATAPATFHAHYLHSFYWFGLFAFMYVVYSIQLLQSI